MTEKRKKKLIFSAMECFEKAFAFYINNWSTKNCSQTQNFPFRYFKMFHFKIHDQKILMLPNSLFSLPPSELIFFPSWATAALHPFSLSPTVSGFPGWRYFFLGMSSLCSFCAQWGGCILLSKSSSIVQSTRHQN